MFDGLALIKWRPNKYPLQRVQSHLSMNGFAANGQRPRSIHRGSFDLHSQRSPSRNSHDLSRTGTPSFHSNIVFRMKKLKRRMNFLMDFQIVGVLMKRMMMSPFGRRFDDFRDEINLFILLGGMRVGINIMIRRILGYGVFGRRSWRFGQKSWLCKKCFSPFFSSIFIFVGFVFMGFILVLFWGWSYLIYLVEWHIHIQIWEESYKCCSVL